MAEDVPERFDLVVIGAGPAGEKGAAQAAYFGKRVAIVESEPEPGGAAVHTGTLPSKTLREAALYLSGHRARDLYGIAISLEPDSTVRRLLARKMAIAEAESVTIRNNLDRHRVHYIRGHGRFVGPHSVLVESSLGETRLESEFTLIATGSKPRRPPDIDFADNRIHDSDEILEISELPASLIVLGGGVIGCEYACMFAALGVRVTLVDTRAEILPFLDLELVERLSGAMRRLGIELRLGRRWSEIRRAGNTVSARLDDGSLLSAEQLQFAAGREGRTDKLGLEEIGVERDSRGYVKVDERFRTGIPSVLAAGDVIGFPALASVSMEQGRVAVCHAFGFGYKKAVAQLMPYGIYTIPEVSAFGETEQTAAAKGIEFVVGRALYRDNARGKITGDLEGLTKIVAERTSRRLIGVHVIGERATELVHIGQSVIELSGSVDVFINMVFNYPSLAESYKYAAYECLAALDRTKA
jgi:NAD(P) transhydrogenase